MQVIIPEAPRTKWICDHPTASIGNKIRQQEQARHDNARIVPWYRLCRDNFALSGARTYPIPRWWYLVVGGHRVGFSLFLRMWRGRRVWWERSTIPVWISPKSFTRAYPVHSTMQTLNPAWRMLVSAEAAKSFFLAWPRHGTRHYVSQPLVLVTYRVVFMLVACVLDWISKMGVLPERYRIH